MGDRVEVKMKKEEEEVLQGRSSPKEESHRGKKEEGDPVQTCSESELESRQPFAEQIGHPAHRLSFPGLRRMERCPFVRHWLATESPRKGLLLQYPTTALGRRVPRSLINGGEQFSSWAPNG